jgi:hypothetical protein
VAAKGPALLAPWPAKGPKKLWQSDPIPTQKEGGFGSVVVVVGKAYLFVGLKDPLIEHHSNTAWFSRHSRFLKINDDFLTNSNTKPYSRFNNT